MTGIKDNRRTLVTKNLLKESLLELLKDKPLEKITVTEIAKRADINRGTFYLHYDSPKGLFADTENELMDEIKPLINGFLQQPSDDFLPNVLNLIKKNPVATQLILEDSENNHVLSTLIEPFREQTQSIIREHFDDVDTTIADYYFEFCISGAINVILKWLRSGSDIAPEQVAEVIYKSVPYS